MKKRKSSLSKSKHVPLASLPPSDSSNEYCNCRQLEAMPPTTTASTGSRFRLPKGWGVEEVPRAHASQIDKYYYEPGTGIKFRSLRAVERHITREDYTPTSREIILRNRSTRYPKKIITDGKMLRLDDEDLNQNKLAIVPSTATTSPCKLPDGWVVEEVPRKDGRFDRYYYEPGTGRKFRSQIAAQRYLAGVDEVRPLAEIHEPWENAPLCKMFKARYHPKNSPSWKKKFTAESTQKSSFVSRPAKINWVIASSQGDAWDPFIGEALIPDSVKNQWTKRFMLYMNDGNYDAQDSNMQS